VKYMCLIYEDSAVQLDSAEREQLMKEYWAFTEEVVGAGKFVGGDALEAPTTATTVRLRSGKTLTTDGPFAETKEFLGGYYILECADLDEALAWAAKIPSARTGSIEVRPVANLG
jgi:hypothetical protein